MPMATIRPVGDGLYHIHFLDAGAGHPDQGLPGAPAYPSHGLPGLPPHVSGGPIYGGGHPSQGLPGQPGHPSQPIFHPGHPDHGLPSRPGGGHFPDHSLPPAQPPQLMPGWTLVLVRAQDGKWKYAAISPGQPVQPLPEPIPPGGKPDQGLPPQQPHPDQGLPGGPPPVAGQPLPPTPQPRR